MPRAPAQWVLLFIAETRGIPNEVVAEIAPRPIFFIHGELDGTVPLAHAYRLQEAPQNPENRLWMVSPAGHVRSYQTHPQEYVRRMTTFFDAALKQYHFLTIQLSNYFP